MRAKLIVLMLLTLLLTLNPNLAAIFKMTNAVCESYNKSWVVVRECRLRAVQRDNTSLNIDVNFLHPAYDIVLWIQMHQKLSGYKPWVINYTVDACQFMRKKYNPFVKMFYNLIKDATTLNHTCPYVGSNGVRDLTLRRETINLPIPTGEYLLLLNRILDGKQTFYTNVYFIFEEEFQRTL